MTIYTVAVDKTDSGAQMDTGPSNAAAGHDMFVLCTWQNGDTGVGITEDTGEDARVRIREIRIGQHSDAGDAAAEILGVTLIRDRQIRGVDTGGALFQNGGQVVVPRPKDGWEDTGGAASRVTVACDVLAKDTGLSVGASASTIVREVMLSDTFNVAAGWWYTPPEEEVMTMEKGDRFIVRLTNAADPLTMKGTLLFEEFAGPV